MSIADIKKVKETIEALESSREILDDLTVDTAVDALKRRLDQLVRAGSGRQMRKFATVLFADVSGFTSICRMNDAEHVTEAINNLWESLDRIIIDSEGRVDKHIGDCVMALWGTDKVKETDALMAVRAALAMQKAAKKISNDSGGLIPPFDIRIGVHTGHLFVSPVGLGGEYTAMGDTVNVASRLQNLAPLGTVLVSEYTWKHVHRFCRGKRQPDAQVKGIDDPVRTWMVEGLRKTAETPEWLSFDSAMVGRKEEMDTLEGVYQRCNSGETCLVTINGKAGLGKSRICHEFLISIAEENSAVIRTGSAPGMEDVPGGLFRTLLVNLFSILESDSREALMKKLHNGMSERLTEEDIRCAAVFTGLRAASEEDSPEDISARGREAVIRFLESLCETARCLVLTAEDIHWADTVSLDLLSDLSRRLKNSSLMVLCTARPELHRRHSNWNEVSDVSIELSPLSPEESGSVAEGILSGIRDMPQALRDLIASNAEGNPFYVEELVKMLAEEGVLDSKNQKITAGNLSGLKVPSTLTGVLQARIDALPQWEKEVLQAASVVGRVFWSMTLKELISHRDIHRALSAVELRDMIRKARRSSFEGSKEYLFKHAMLRDVTYETVLIKSRKKFHSLVGDWIVKNAEERAEEFASVIARHFEIACRWQDALTWLQKAINSALRVSAYREALSMCERALSAPEKEFTDEVRADLLVNKGSCLEKLSRYPEASEALIMAAELARRKGLNKAGASSLSTLSWVSIVTGRREEGRKYAVESMEFAERSEDPNIMARSIMRLADYEEEKTFDSQTGFCMKALELYRGAGNRRGMATALLNLGNTAIGWNKIEKADKWYRESLEIYTATGDRWGTANCLGNLGLVASASGDLEAARDFHRRGLEASMEIGDREGEVICCFNLGEIALKQNDLSLALKYLKRALSVSKDTGLRVLMVSVLRSTAQCFLKQGNTVLARKILIALSSSKFQVAEEKERVAELLAAAGSETAPEEPVTLEEMVDILIDQ